MSKYDSVFNEDMTSLEAWHTYFEYCERISKDEIEDLREAFSKVARKITARELEKAKEGWMD